RPKRRPENLGASPSRISILFASDRNATRTRAQVFGTTLWPGPVLVPPHSHAAYGNPEDPLGVLVEPDARASPFKDLKRIAAIRPGFIPSTAPSFHVVAWLP